MRQLRQLCIWAAFAAVVFVPIVAAFYSPLLAWRDPIYITAGFAGVAAMVLLLVQPLLAGGYLPGLPVKRGRPLHRIIGGLLVLAVIVHVGGLWITSPPDVIDALLFVSPTPFSIWGVIAMWAVFATAVVAAYRGRMRANPRRWRRLHAAFAVVIVLCTAAHAILIVGTMETVSKAALSVGILAVTAKVLVDLRVFARRTKSG